MIRISLCDDENHITGTLSDNIKGIRPDIEVYSYDCGENLLDSKYLYNDIVLLDIEMTGINGIETALELRKGGYEGMIIFLTSHKEMVFDSFQVKPYNYFVKPIDIDKVNRILKNAINEVIDRKTTHFEAVSNNHTFRIQIDDIYYFECNGRKIDIHTKNGIITIIGKMNQIEASLQNKQFFRCHKGYLVNFEHVCEFSNNEIILTNNQKVLISRLKINSFKEAFKAFMKGNIRC
ncbi:two component transcriptional regulator, LytTR family [Ruminiclostridium papyrosolvens DSM 2782]|uniref:Stage 0 sporulation protein A homolog n=1 Tax=Ruminiclostridium papyrosolvens DSM 2782 TaxID=588581 RepID=F1T8D4_9FIRM|nr:LytTR family DNA-binding domain-containing protein [Ruminiclostridium papyrosolvens]EGD49732.1 two component transcriptional regulator, LytTR family [Ruminiclostridium papyrosolvens DSM 2782]WES33141.1 LytTR family DNA-binding domain-containing protein [Ruminiclostridium papyrosolvens DSM 2782]